MFHASSRLLPLTLSVLCLTVATAALPSAAVADGMYCGNRLVMEGDTQARVLARCGQPIAKQVRRGISSVSFGGWPYAPRCAGRDADCLTHWGYAREVIIEEWFYDRGTHQLTRRLVFEDGILVTVTAGPYGDTLVEASKSRQQQARERGPQAR